MAPLSRMELLEYVSLSSTNVHANAVASLARDRRLRVSLPDAPKTRARCNRTLLTGSNWSKRQFTFTTRKIPARSRFDAALLQYGHGAIQRGWDRGPSKMLRLGMPCPGTRGASRVRLKFEDGQTTPGGDGRELLTKLVGNIVRLWPPVPFR